MAEYVNERFLLAIAMDQVTARGHLGLWPKFKSADDETIRLLNFAAAFVRIHDQVPARARRKLEARLQGALYDKDSQALTGLAFELRALVNLMHKGVEVEWCDLEEAERFDLRAHKDALHVNIECKTFSADLGRKIHQERAHRVGGLINADLKQAVDAGHTALIDVVLPDRLTGSDLSSIAERIRTALRTHASVGGPRPCSITFNPFSLRGTPFDGSSDLSQDAIRAFLQEKFGIENKSLIVRANRGTAAILVVLRSDRADDVRPSMQKRLREAARQLPTEMPGIVCVQLLDLTGDELREIRDAVHDDGRHTEMRALLEWFFGGEDRRHIHTLSFIGAAQVSRSVQTVGNIQTTKLSETGGGVYWGNARHPLTSDERMKDFL